MIRFDPINDECNTLSSGPVRVHCLIITTNGENNTTIFDATYFANSTYAGSCRVLDTCKKLSKNKISYLMISSRLLIARGNRA